MDTRDQFLGALQTALAKWNISPTADQCHRLAHHFERVLIVNETCNLTRITGPVEAAVLHVADSLALLSWAESKSTEQIRLLDIGTGAGFPSVPLAIMRPEWQIAAIDATRKKIAFVSEVRDELRLTNLICEQAHTDHFRPPHCFEIVASRAFSQLGDCLKAANQFVARGGFVVTYKTPKMTEEERSEADRISKRLGFTTEDAFNYTLELQGEEHQRLLDVRRKRE